MYSKSHNVRALFQHTFDGILFRFIKLLLTGLLIAPISCSQNHPPKAALTIDPVLRQAVFAAPDDAAETLVQAVSSRDSARLSKILGADYQDVLPIELIDKQDIDSFLTSWKQRHSLLDLEENRKMIAVGEDQWTMPIPIVKAKSGWYFAIEEGLENMRIRRIGRNELAAMQAVLAYYDAQLEYAELDREGDGILEYAQQLISTPGSRDGLYWDTKPGEPLSPLGALIGDRSPGGGYHGYYYKILTAQGKHAEGGAYDYRIGPDMRAGFALIAWPIKYGETGIMSFMVSHAGVVHESDLGPEGPKVVENMQLYDPDNRWTVTQDVNEALSTSGTNE